MGIQTPTAEVREFSGALRSADVSQRSGQDVGAW